MTSVKTLSEDVIFGVLDSLEINGPSCDFNDFEEGYTEALKNAEERYKGCLAQQVEAGKPNIISLVEALIAGLNAHGELVEIEISRSGKSGTSIFDRPRLYEYYATTKFVSVQE